MAERDSVFVPGALVDVEEARVGIGALWTPGTSSAVKAKTGLRPGPNSPGLVTATGTPDGFVHVAAFQAIIQSTRGTVAGAYIATLDAVKNLNMLSTVADSTNPRNDLVIAVQSDTFYGDAGSAFLVRQVVGTPSGSPADPSLAAFPDAITLARVRVNANATTITSGNITDLRPSNTVALGGLLPVASQTLRDALTGMYDGTAIYRTDRDWIEAYDGAAWRVQGIAIVVSVADLAAVTNPYTGQIASNTGDSMLYRYNGSAWRVHGNYRVVQTLGGSAASVTFSGIPTYLREVIISYTSRGDTAANNVDVGYRINGDTGIQYRYVHIFEQNAGSPPGTFRNLNSTTGKAGTMPGSTAQANLFGVNEVKITGWNSPHAGWLAARGHGGYLDTSGDVLSTWLSAYGPVGPYTSITLLPASGNFVSGSEFILNGVE